MNTQAYYQGDYWEPMEPVDPGMAPAEPRWRRLRVPSEIQTAVIHLAAGYALAGDGLADQARLFLAQGEQLLRAAAAQVASQQPGRIPVRIH